MLSKALIALYFAVKSRREAKQSLSWTDSGRIVSIGLKTYHTNCVLLCNEIAIQNLQFSFQI